MAGSIVQDDTFQRSTLVRNGRRERPAIRTPASRSIPCCAGSPGPVSAGISCSAPSCPTGGMSAAPTIPASCKTSKSESLGSSACRCLMWPMRGCRWSRRVIRVRSSGAFATPTAPVWLPRSIRRSGVRQPVVRNLRDTVPPPCRPPVDGLEWRDRIVGARTATSLESVATNLWELGIPVVPLDVLPAPSFQGMACIVEDRPVILLGHKHDEPGRVAFVIAHEAGHIAAGDCTAGRRRSSTKSPRLPTTERWSGARTGTPTTFYWARPTCRSWARPTPGGSRSWRGEQVKSNRRRERMQVS